MDLQTAINILCDLAAEDIDPKEYEAYMIALDAMSYQKATRPYDREFIPFSEKETGRCSRCGYVVLSNENNCDNCGQKLRWGD